MFVVVIFLALTSIQAMHWSGNRLFDLECQGSHFAKEAQSWNVMTSLNNKTLKTTQCHSDIVLGGPGIWVTVQPISGWWRQYSNLPTHHGVTVEMKIYPIDGWADQDHFSLQIDTYSEDYWVLNQQSNPTATANICGPSTADILPLTVYRTVDHRVPKLYLYIMTWINRPSEIASIGVREIVLTFFNLTTTNSNEKIPTSTCGVAPYDLGSRACSCDSSLELVTGKSGYCAICHETCLLCNKSGTFGCTACKSGDYLTSEGSCLKCDSPCQTCSGDADFCITCKDGSEPSINATCPPVIDCPTPLKIIDNVCKPDCSSNQFPFWDGCLEDCVPPLSLQIISSFPVCTFPCEDPSHFLDWNGNCSPTCPFPYEKSAFSNRNFCFPCSGDAEVFSYWNGTCSATCALPLVAKKLGKKQICTYPCERDYFLYLDGSCQKDCPSPYTVQITPDSKKYCNLICTQRQYLEADKKSCKNIQLPGQFPLEVIKINNEPTKLFLIEKTFNAENEETFTLFSEEYKIGSVWTFFALDPLEEYSLDNWSATAKCGCFTQVCGRHCEKGASCSAHENKSVPLICHPWAERNNFCWNVFPSGKNWYTAYSLKYHASIALTSYGGLDDTDVRPGFTVSNNQGFFDYSANGLIMKMTPRDNVDLQSSYRYAESEGKVIRTQDFEALNYPPEIQADLSAASCNSSTMRLPLKLLTRADRAPVSFSPYLIIRKADNPKIIDIPHFNILTSNGLLKWNDHQETFDFLDPCNQQFLTLQKDSVGNFFVKLPTSQKLMNFESIICIAVQDHQASSQYDLVLYELKNTTSIWSASDRFVGLLANDYIQDYTIRLTVNTDHIVTLPKNNKINIEFDLDIKGELSFKITTTLATTCKIYLSPICHFDMITTSEHLYTSKQLQTQCGYLYEKAAYDCQGMMGYFYPPLSLVKTRLSNFFENTTLHKLWAENFDTFKPYLDDEEDIISIFYEWIIYWTWQNYLTKILVLVGMVIPIVTGVIFCSLICTRRPRPRNFKSRQYEAVKNI